MAGYQGTPSWADTGKRRTPMDDSKEQPSPSGGLAVNDKGNINIMFPYGKPQIAQKQRSKSICN